MNPVAEVPGQTDRLSLRPAAALPRSSGIMSLVCHDGSADAQAAIDQAGLLMPSSEATVLVNPETILDMSRHGCLSMGIGMVAPFGDDEADAAIRKGALETADNGVSAGRGCRTGRAIDGREPKRRDRRCDRRRSRRGERRRDRLGYPRARSVKSLMLGSVVRAVVHHSDRPVLLVPWSVLAERRRAVPSLPSSSLVSNESACAARRLGSSRALCRIGDPRRVGLASLTLVRSDSPSPFSG